MASNFRANSSFVDLRPMDGGSLPVSAWMHESTGDEFARKLEAISYFALSLTKRET